VAGPPPAESASGAVKLSAKAVEQLGIECRRPAKRDVQAVISADRMVGVTAGERARREVAAHGYLAAKNGEPAWRWERASSGIRRCNG